MEKINEKDLGEATYRSRDPIKNFKIKVKLKRLSASALEFLGQANEAGEEGTRSSVTNQFGQTILEQEELTVQWQQKVFSQREMEFYAFEPNCKSVQDYKYHAEVEKIKGNQPNKRLFTYVDNDRFSAVENAFVPMTTSPDEVPSELNNRVMEIRQRKRVSSQAASSTWDLNRGRSVTGMKLVEKVPNEEFKSNHHVLNTPVHTFIIMADLSPEGQLGRAEFEHRLCKIEYDENYVMRVTPDFSESKAPYRVEDHGLSRDVWEYKIAHVSHAVSKLEVQREGKVISELYRKHQNYLKSLVGEEFEELPNGLFRFLAYGEILSAESFEYDDLHVEYFLDVPKYWSSDPAQLLSGCTHTCQTRLFGNIEKAYFSHPFNYQLFLPLRGEDTDLEWPKMFLHVISSDTWGRRRTEGYGYFSLPTSPGVHNICVPCWRPTGNAGYDSIHASMRRYFIGGSPELEDLSYTAVPSTFEGKQLSKFGVRTEASGCLRIRVNCVQQCQAFQEELSTLISKKKLQGALQLAKGRASTAAARSVMDAYQRARKRMQLARENVPSQIVESVHKTVDSKMRGLTIEDNIKNAVMKAERE